MAKKYIKSYSSESPKIEHDSLEDSAVSDENVPGFSKENNIATSDSYDNISDVLDKDDTDTPEKLQKMLQLKIDLNLSNSESLVESKLANDLTDGLLKNAQKEKNSDTLVFLLLFFLM